MDTSLSFNRSFRSEVETLGWTDVSGQTQGEVDGGGGLGSYPRVEDVTFDLRDPCGTTGVSGGVGRRGDPSH